MRVREKLPAVPRKIPESLKTGPLIRLMDRIVMAGERLEARIERARMASDAEAREAKRAVFVFSALTVVYGIFGEPAHTSLFFATVGAIAIGGKAWHSWRRNDQDAAASESDGGKVLRLASEIGVTLVAVFALAAVMLVSMPTFPGRERGVVLITPVIVGALAYRRRKASDPAPEHTLFVTAAFFLAVGAVMSFFWFLGR